MKRVALAMLLALAMTASFEAAAQDNSSVNGRHRASVPTPPPFRRRAALPPSLTVQLNDLKVTNRLLAQYAKADYKPLWSYMESHLDDGGNPNFACIPASEGLGYIQRYESEGHKPVDMDLALDNFEIMTKLYPAWGKRWLSPAPAAFLAIQVYRLKHEHELSFIQLNRIEILWEKAKRIVEGEANYWLSVPLPLQPWDSSDTGDTKAEEDAWLVSIFAAAEVYIPNSPNVPEWAARARELAYDAITRPSDPPYIPAPDSPYQSIVKTSTVSDAFILKNHGPESPYYVNATLLLLQLGSLVYRTAGRDIPEEFYHNVPGLYDKSKSYISRGSDGKFLVDSSGKFFWSMSNLIDPANPMDFPFPMGEDRSLDEDLTAQKAASGYLWMRPVQAEGNVLSSGTTAWQAVQDHKALWYYQISYEWNWPNP